MTNISVLRRQGGRIPTSKNPYWDGREVGYIKKIRFCRKLAAVPRFRGREYLQGPPLIMLDLICIRYSSPKNSTVVVKHVQITVLGRSQSNKDQLTTSGIVASRRSTANIAVVLLSQSRIRARMRPKVDHCPPHQRRLALLAERCRVQDLRTKVKSRSSMIRMILCRCCYCQF